MAVYRIRDVINNYREREGMTQAELGEGICEPETVSRIENGHHIPSRRVYLELMKKMGQEGSRQRPFLVTFDKEIYQIKRELDLLIRVHEYERAESLLNKLQRKLDITEAQNMQFLLRTSAIIQYRTGRITKEERRNIFEQAVKLTVKWYGEQSLEKGFYTHNEVILLCNIATAYFEEGNEKKAIQMLVELKEYFDNSVVSEEEIAQNKVLVLDNLQQCYGLVKAYGKSLEISEEGIEQCLNGKKEGILCNFIYNRAYVLEKMNKKESACKELVQALCIAKALEYDYMYKHIYRHVCENSNV